MATAKQLAWRRKFAAMAKAGTLKKAAKKTTRKSNPAPSSDLHNRKSQWLMYFVEVDGGVVAGFRSSHAAAEYAELLAEAYPKKHIVWTGS